ncbi:hypothetical protein HYX01_04845 [Candidatus Woesearchaeota archaeon]|nr:hypothetical protein [Candidatus Woesearchaeota archaeon]
MPYRNLDDILVYVKEQYANTDPLVFAGVTAVNDPMTAFQTNVVSYTKFSIVTANKNPIALSPYKVFQILTENTGRYGYRCSVMAGPRITAQNLRGGLLNVGNVRNC